MARMSMSMKYQWRHGVSITMASANVIWRRSISAAQLWWRLSMAVNIQRIQWRNLAKISMLSVSQLSQLSKSLSAIKHPRRNWLAGWRWRRSWRRRKR